MKYAPRTPAMAPIMGTVEWGLKRMWVRAALSPPAR